MAKSGVVTDAITTTVDTGVDTAVQAVGNFFW